MMDNFSIFKLISSNTLYLLIVCFVTALLVLCSELKRSLNKSKKSTDMLINRPPGPKPLPIIGNLPALDGYEVPYQAFTELGKKYGPIVSLQLGSIPAVAVNGIENIKEVLIQKSAHFDSRPNFRRYHELFYGNKENSLAFCDWSDIQKARRDMLTPHTFPKNFSNRHGELNSIITNQMEIMLNQIEMKSQSSQIMEIKPMIMYTCANIFTEYFCTRSFKVSNTKFQKMIQNFDKIFYEVNQGYAADFLPFLMPFHRKNLKRMEQWSHEIREFILEAIIENRKLTWQQKTSNPSDYVENLIDHVLQEQSDQTQFDWDTALFALEDIIGGHSAVGNFLVKTFGYLALNENVQLEIQKEIDCVLANKSDMNKFIDLNDRHQMPYTESVIMESLRLIASPIVPHVSNQNSTIGGFDIEKNTLIFLNNYDLSMDPALWSEPNKFDPSRFIVDGQIKKPDYFLPFGGGRRSCMGYKMVQFLSFSIIANLIKSYSLLPCPGDKFRVQSGSLAMPENSYKFQFIARQQ